MIIIVAAAVLSEADIQQEIQRIQASPEGRDVFNQELLRDMALNNLRRKEVGMPQEEEPFVSPEGATYEVEPTAPGMAAQPVTVPSPVRPEQPTEDVIRGQEGSTEVKAQKLYEAYRASTDENKKNEIVNAILMLPYEGVTLGEWMSTEIWKAEQTGKVKGLEEWIYGVLDRPDVRNFLSMLVKTKSYFGVGVDKSQKNFESYIDQNGNINGELIPRHFKQGADLAIPNESIFRVAKSRVVPLPNGNVPYSSVRYMGKPIKPILERFSSLDDVEMGKFSKTNDAIILRQYLEDLMVVESYMWNRHEYRGNQQDLSHGFVPAGNEGSRTYSAIDNLNRTYSLVSPYFGLPQEADPNFMRTTTGITMKPGDPRLALQVRPKEIMDPRDEALSRPTRTFRTENKVTYAIMTTMLNKFVIGVIGKMPQEELDRVESELNSKLPENQRISLQKKDYAPGGKFWVENRMIATAKQEINPNKVREQRQRASGQMRNVSMDVAGVGEEGEQTKYEYSQEQAKESVGLGKTIQKPSLSQNPSNYTNGPMAPSIAKEMFDKMESGPIGEEEGKGYVQSVDDPTWKLVEQIQNRTEELKKTLPTNPHPPQDALVYPIRPMGTEGFKTIRNVLVESPEQIEQGRQEMLRSLTEMVAPDQESQAAVGDPIDYIRKQLDNYMPGINFDIKPVIGRYLYIKPMGIDPEKEREVLESLSDVMRLITHDRLPKMTDASGNIKMDPAIVPEIIRGYLFSTRDIKDLTQNPTSYSSQYGKFVNEQASQMAREEVMRTEAPELAKTFGLPEDAFTKKIDDFYKMVGKSKNIEMLKNRSARSALFSKAANSLYGKEIPFQDVSRDWKVLGGAKMRSLKNSVAHELSRLLTPTTSLDRVVMEIFDKIKVNEAMDADLMAGLSQAEKRGRNSLLQATYKVINEVMGEMIGVLIREEFGATKEQVQSAINLLRMVRLAITSRMMTKMG